MSLLIEQINRCWGLLPAVMTEDPELRSRIQNVDDAQFRGALGEVFTYVVLSRLGLSAGFKPQLGSQTPDFYIQARTHSFIVESACVGRVEQDRDVDRAMELFRAEIASIRARYWIHLSCPPIPAANGNLHGLGQALAKYLTTDPLPEPRDDSDGYGEPVHWVERNGAKVGFRVTPKDVEGPVLAGANLGLRTGDSGAEALERVIQKKIDKYRFPFVLACVIDSSADLDSLLKAMIGTPAMSIAVRPDGGADVDRVRQTHTNDGFWGTDNSNIHRHLHLQGILFIKEHYSNEFGIRLYVHFLENPHVHSSLRTVFPQVPEVLSANWNGRFSEIPGLCVEL